MEERFEEFLAELYWLTFKEYKEKLSDKEEKRYAFLYEHLVANGIEIPFGVEI